ncbi:aldo/keto reductase [Aggregicoccus sp. 17bor-14]|uniref:aldo/keto reductase n=1 Tax=Myxococcaceae TaxID=31 RepID=UPI00129CA0EF|nr:MULTISPECIES: aldo/keto reductase [Myxococcaceae]MBF5044798.1 aldo/keto reductase [Simulacricoccus sp. 17bor-14]MRI90542.1 aldo/keto reductase [Aggregicoccus sp. 17bor-14]
MTRTLGRTGLAVSRLGLGLAALGRPGYITLGHAEDLGRDRSEEALEAHAHAVLDAAWAAGVRYVDAARSYGRAEAFLSSWLARRGIAPGALSVGSKWGYTYTAGWRVDAPKHEVKEHSLATLERQVQESRALLGAYLGLYQIHSATRESGVLEDAGVLDGLARLRDGGLAVGLSLSGAGQADTLRRALEVRRGGQPLFACVQATWNLLEPSVGPALADAHASGMGVIVKEVVANGRLTPRNGEPGLAPLREAAVQLGASVDAVAVAAALAQPWADVVLSGAATVAQLQSHLSAQALVLPERGLEGLAEQPRVYWERRSGLAWN